MSSYLNSDLWRLIFSFDRTFHEYYKKCMMEVKKRWKYYDYHSLCFMDENENSINYRIIPCVRNIQGRCNCWAQRDKNPCKGVLELVGDYEPENIFLYNGGKTNTNKYNLFDLVSSAGLGIHTVCLDLNELDWSMREFKVF